MKQQKLKRALKNKAIKFDDGKPPLHLLPSCTYQALRLYSGQEDIYTSSDPCFRRSVDYLLESLDGNVDFGLCIKKATVYTIAAMRLRYGLGETFDLVAEVLKFGAAKYGPYNWVKGMEYTRLQRAAIGHLLRQGTLDKETKLPHEAHALCDQLFLWEYAERGLGVDDRFKYPEKKGAL